MMYEELLKAEQTSEGIGRVLDSITGKNINWKEFVEKILHPSSSSQLCIPLVIPMIRQRVHPCSIPSIDELSIKWCIDSCNSLSDNVMKSLIFPSYQQMPSLNSLAAICSMALSIPAILSPFFALQTIYTLLKEANLTNKSDSSVVFPKELVRGIFMLAVHSRLEGFGESIFICKKSSWIMLKEIMRHLKARFTIDWTFEESISMNLCKCIMRLHYFDENFVPMLYCLLDSESDFDWNCVQISNVEQDVGEAKAIKDFKMARYEIEDSEKIQLNFQLSLHSYLNTCLGTEGNVLKCRFALFQCLSLLDNCSQVDFVYKRIVFHLERVSQICRVEGNSARLLRTLFHSLKVFCKTLELKLVTQEPLELLKGLSNSLMYIALYPIPPFITTALISCMQFLQSLCFNSFILSNACLAIAQTYSQDYLLAQLSRIIKGEESPIQPANPVSDKECIHLLELLSESLPLDKDKTLQVLYQIDANRVFAFSQQLEGYLQLLPKLWLKSEDISEMLAHSTVLASILESTESTPLQQLLVTNYIQTLEEIQAPSTDYALLSIFPQVYLIASPEQRPSMLVHISRIEGNSSYTLGLISQLMFGTERITHFGTERITHFQ